MTLAAFWRWMNKSDEKFILMSSSAFCVEIRASAYPSNQEHGASGNLEHVAGYVNVFTWLRERVHMATRPVQRPGGSFSQQAWCCCSFM